MTDPDRLAPPGSAQDESAPRAPSEPRRPRPARRRPRRKARERYRPTEKDRKLIRALSGYGIPPEDIVLIFLPLGEASPLSVDQLRRLFADEIQTGPARLTAKVAERLYNATEGKNAAAVAAQRAWLDVRGGPGWKRKVKVEVAVDPETGVVL